MELCEMIYKRKSTRSYTGEPVDDETIQKIREFSAGVKPLYPEIRVCAEIISSDNVKCILPWTTPQVIAIFSEEAKGAMENVGFCYQQLELYLQTLGLGACWLGMGRLDTKGNEDLDQRDGMKFAMMIAFGYPKEKLLRQSKGEFRRKALKEIADREDDRLEPARLAPSSVNSQPWYFAHEGDIIHAYCILSGLIKRKKPSYMNLIDMGIALAHLYLCHQDTFCFSQAKQVPTVKGYSYIGSFTL